MFSSQVLDRFHNPRNAEALDAPTHTGTAGVPGDGPYVVLQFVVRDGVIVRSAFRTFGCPAAIACASMTTELVTGRPVEKALLLNERDLVLALGGLPEGKEHCPRLAVEALHRALPPGEDR